jgi:hypothetical protein
MPRAPQPKHLFYLLLLILLAWGLQNIPGTFSLDDIEEAFEVGSLEGRAFLSLGRCDVKAELYFAEPARHRISRNAELLVPADTWLIMSGTMIPAKEGEEVVLRPGELELRSDRPLTFIYRQVTVARSKHLRTNEEGTLQAVGHYQALSALRTAYRYQRQREIRRDYQIPTEASLALSVELIELEPLVNSLLGDTIPSTFDLGSVFEIKLERIHHLLFSENHLDLHVDGNLHSAQSRRVSQMFQPGFRARLAVDFHLPREQPLSESEIGVSLRNIHTIDLNHSNPIFDKTIRDLARSYREQARILVDIAEEFPEISEWPGELFIKQLAIDQGEQNDAVLNLHLRWSSTTRLR